MNSLSTHHDVLRQRTKGHNDNLVPCCPLFYNPICDTAKCKICMVLQLLDVPIHIIIVYRPPPSKQNKISATTFLKELELFIGELAISSGRLVIMGDFNIHFDKISEPETKKLKNILAELGLKQHVTDPTHRCGHILDLIVSHESDTFLSDIHVEHSIDQCDHTSIICS